MATNIRLKAAKLLNKQHPSSYYDAAGCKINPVFASFKAERDDFLSNLRKKLTDVTSIHGRKSMILFEMLKKYRHLLPQEYFFKQILKIGSLLREEEEYILELSCYNFYFLELNMNDSTIQDLSSYSSSYFPQGMNSDAALLTVQILVANYFCLYQIEKLKNCLTCNEAAAECEKILLSYQMLTQILLYEDSYYWLLYNCTVHIYTICLEMMMAGHSAKILEHLLWACMCIENSSPLSDIQYMCWRCSLYTTICQCYWEYKSGEHAEAFARRALCKMNDIWSPLIKHENGKNNQLVLIVRECTLKMGFMIFKRVVFETRRKMKGVLRVKNRFTEKDFANMVWPRTITEKLLAEMFDSESAQFLAILESLNDTHRRLLTPGGIFQGEVELIDVSLELLVAAKEILSGNAVSNRMRKDSPNNVLANVTQMEDYSLLELAIKGESKVPLKAVFRLALLAFSYEQWEIFYYLSDALQRVRDEQYDWDMRCLQLLISMKEIAHGRKYKKAQISNSSSILDSDDEVDSDDLSENIPSLQPGYVNVAFVDDLFHMSEVLKSVLTSNISPLQDDMNIVLDVLFFLWNQSKVIIRRLKIGFEDNLKYFPKNENSSKWISILDVIFSVMCWREVACIDIAAMSEVTLRLALLLETCSTLTQGKKSWKDVEKKELLILSGMPFGKEKDFSNSNSNHSYFIPSDVNLLCKEDFLILSRSVLTKGLADINKGRNSTATKEKEIIRNAFYLKEIDNKLCDVESSGKTEGENVNKDELLNAESFLCHSIRDQHTELLFLYYRVSCKLINTDSFPIKSDTKKDVQQLKRKTKKKKEDSSMIDYDTLLNDCGSNNLLKAFLKMHTAMMMKESRSEMLQQSLNCIMKFQKEEAKIYEMYNKISQHDKESTVPKTDLPLAPILLWRSTSTIAFKPSKFNSSSGEKVCWYRLFAHIISTHYDKVRLNDTPVPGTGNLIPADHKEIIVSGLKTNQQYVFALAAYSYDGKLIGDSIGESTAPILVSNSLSIPLTYLFLCQVSYQLRYFTISEQIFDFLYSHFVSNHDSQSPTTENIPAVQKFLKKFPRMNENVKITASPILLRQFFACIMLSVDINIHREKLFCDKICDHGPFKPRQKKRLAECKKLLLGIDEAGFLNDCNLCVQALVQIYGLLVPFIYHSWIVLPVTQIFLYCYGVLQALSGNLHQKKTGSVVESMQHMIICIVYHLVKMLYKMKERHVASEICENSCRMLQENINARRSSSQNFDSFIGEPDVMNEKVEPPLWSYNKLRWTIRLKQDSSFESTARDELTVLEEALANISRQACYDADVGVREDESISLICCSIMSSRHGFKEASKYKKKNNFHEFVTRVINQANSEREYVSADIYCEELHNFFDRLDMKFQGKLRADNVQDKGLARHSTYMPEYKKQPDFIKSQAQKEKKKKRLFPTDGPELEALKLKVLPVFAKCLPKYVKNYLSKMHTRLLMTKELPCRCQLNLLQAIVIFNGLFDKYEYLYRIQPYANAENYGKHFDHNWISFENTGLLLNYQVVRKTGVTVVKPDERHTPTTPTKYSLGSYSKVHIDMTPETIYDSISKILLHLKRALVLSHRGELWSSFQNINKILWDIIHTIQSRFVGTHLGTASNTIYLSVESFTDLIYPVLLTASDLILDMLKMFKNTKEEGKSQSTENFCINIDHWSSPLGDCKAGASFHFDPFFDDITIIDGYIIEKICKKAMYVIHRLAKWEHLIDLILQYNGLTNEKFAEFTIPLLIDAQLNLEKQRKSQNCSIFVDIQELVNKPDGSLSAKQYLNLQLNIYMDKTYNSNVPIGAYLDEEEHTVYNGDGSMLIAVPIDVDSSWKYIQSVLEESNYTMRSVYHSRQLLHLFIAGRFYTQNSKTTGEQVEIRPRFVYLENILEPLPSPELHLNFDSPGDTISCFKASLISDNVITSYTQTIELLLNKNEKDIAAQMLSEMAYVQLISGDRKTAFQTWISSLQLILRLGKKPVTNWKDIYQSEDIEAQLLKTCGIWGCLFAGTVATIIARFCIVADKSFQLEYCFLAYHLFKAIFSGSLEHPQLDIMFAKYNVGENFLSRQIISDLPLFGDHYRLPSKQLDFSLLWIIETLFTYGYYLKMLPLLTLHIHLSRSVYRDLRHYIQGKLYRLRAFTCLHMFTEATRVAQQLLNGFHLPLITISLTRLIETRLDHLVFDSSLNLTDPINLKVLHFICGKSLPNQLTSLYGPHIYCELSLAIIRLILTIAECINVIPEEDDNFPTIIKGLFYPHDIDSNDMSQNIFTSSEGPIALERMKALLLSVANHRLDTLTNEIQSKQDNKTKTLSAFYLDLKIKCYFERSRFYQQKHQFYYAAKRCIAAMQLMQQLNSDISTTATSPKGKTPESISESNASEVKSGILNNSSDNMEYLPRIGSAFWLKCRLNLVKNMNSFVVSNESFKDFGEILMQDLSSIVRYCLEGQQEAKSCKDLENEAAFIYMEALDQFKITSSEASSDLCQKGINVIQQCQELSVDGFQTLANLLMLQTDLQIKTNIPMTLSSAKNAIDVYIKVKELIKNRLQVLEPNIELKKMKNIYLPFLDILADVDLRIGLISVKHSQCSDINDLTSVESKLGAKVFSSLELLNEAILLNQSINFYRPNFAMEILLQTGKILRYLSEIIPPVAPINLFISAIKVAYSSHQSIVLTKNAYLEIGLVCLSYIKGSATFHCQKLRQKSGKNGVENRFCLLEPQKRKYFALLAWLAIRTTGILSGKHMEEIKLSGTMQFVSQVEMTPKSYNKIPEYINLDLFGRYVFGKNNTKYDVSDVLVLENQKNENIDSDEEKMKSFKNLNSSKITWFHIFSYYIYLSDQLHQTNISTSETFLNGDSKPDEAPESFYRTFLYSMSLDHSMKLQYDNTYSFMTQNFPLFTQNCSIINIPVEIEEVAAVINNIVEETQTVTPDSVKILNLESLTPPKFSAQESHIVYNRAIFPSSLQFPRYEEVCFQWYSPLLDSVSQKKPQNPSDSNYLYLLCAITKKLKADEILCYTNFFILPCNFAIDLYKRIKNVIYLKEMTEKPANIKSKKSMYTPKKSISATGPDQEVPEYQKQLITILQDILQELLPKANDVILQLPFEFESGQLNQLLELFNVNKGSFLVTGDLASWLANHFFSEKN